MSDEVQVVVIPNVITYQVTVAEAPIYRVSLFPVTVAHPSILEAAGRAEGSAENASQSAQAAALAAQSAIEAVNSIGDTVAAAVEEKLEEALPGLAADSIKYALIFG